MSLSGFQSTPPRGGRRSRQNRSNRRKGISIHAPTRGATTARRCTLDGDCHFNPRPHAGGDKSLLNMSNVHKISIHAPTRGATMIGLIRTQENPVFQSTPPRGGRPFVDCRNLSVLSFQSTPPRGGRPPPLYSPIKTMLFQSTPPRGGRLACRARPRQRVRDFNPRPHAGGD